MGAGNSVSWRRFRVEKQTIMGYKSAVRWGEFWTECLFLLPLVIAYVTLVKRAVLLLDYWQLTCVSIVIWWICKYCSKSVFMLQTSSLVLKCFHLFMFPHFDSALFHLGSSSILSFLLFFFPPRGRNFFLYLNYAGTCIMLCVCWFFFLFALATHGFPFVQWHVK